ncbi:hypothetical protein [Limibacillus halophilus]|uniref:Putative nucleic acid-binding Zn-ribbon protein n=1 Tax=Limibacillus halophilus TaxID=1579333 RepID=A0A839SRR0_9PROT|nr:hypothetical protein [Limibacillus halophilus]MBB3064400.1 putative nucleic acid-binding Zn-ribbon protein [Limibacillus halophilus]
MLDDDNRKKNPDKIVQSRGDAVSGIGFRRPLGLGIENDPEDVKTFRAAMAAAGRVPMVMGHPERKADEPDDLLFQSFGAMKEAAGLPPSRKIMPGDAAEALLRKAVDDKEDGADVFNALLRGGDPRALQAQRREREAAKKQAGVLTRSQANEDRPPLSRPPEPTFERAARQPSAQARPSQAQEAFQPPGEERREMLRERGKLAEALNGPLTKTQESSIGRDLDALDRRIAAFDKREAAQERAAAQTQAQSNRAQSAAQTRRTQVGEATAGVQDTSAANATQAGPQADAKPTLPKPKAAVSDDRPSDKQAADSHPSEALDGREDRNRLSTIVQPIPGAPDDKRQTTKNGTATLLKDRSVIDSQLDDIKEQIKAQAMTPAGREPHSDPELTQLRRDRDALLQQKSQLDEKVKEEIDARSFTKPENASLADGLVAEIEKAAIAQGPLSADVTKKFEDISDQAGDLVKAAGGLQKLQEDRDALNRRFEDLQEQLSNPEGLSPDEIRQLRDEQFKVFNETLSLGNEIAEKRIEFEGQATFFNHLRAASILSDLIASEGADKTLDLLFGIIDAASNGGVVGGALSGVRTAIKKPNPAGMLASVVLGALEGAITDAAAEQVKQFLADGKLDDLPHLMKADPSKAVDLMGELAVIDFLGSVLSVLPDLLDPKARLRR